VIKKTLAYFAKRTHDIKLQLLLATLYGLVSLFGTGGAIMIIIKARKLHKPTKVVKRAATM
jgi:hypothetical protein